MTKDELLDRCEKALNDYENGLITKKQSDKRIAEAWGEYKKYKSDKATQTDCPWK